MENYKDNQEDVEIEDKDNQEDVEIEDNDVDAGVLLECHCPYCCGCFNLQDADENYPYDEREY